MSADACFEVSPSEETPIFKSTNEAAEGGPALIPAEQVQADDAERKREQERLNEAAGSRVGQIARVTGQEEIKK